MQVGDLVKFSDHTLDSGPLGIVTELNELVAEPHPSQPQTSVAWIEWIDTTAAGYYQLFLLEVVNESR